SSSTSNQAQISALASASGEDFVHAIMQKKPWDRGVFLNGGLGTDGEADDHFLSAGIRIGKVLSSPIAPGIFRGQFEYAAEIIPYWQAFTPKETYILSRGNPPQPVSVTTGGTYTGLSLTPIILRLNLVRDSGHWK